MTNHQDTKTLIKTLCLGAFVVQIPSGNIGSTIDQYTLESLPIVGTSGRNPLDLLNFQPGVVFGGNTGGAVNVNGSRDRAFNFTLDGIDINESTAGGSNFTLLRPNPDSVAEFQVVTSKLHRGARPQQWRSGHARHALRLQRFSRQLVRVLSNARTRCEELSHYDRGPAQRSVCSAYLRRQPWWSTLQSGLWRGYEGRLVERQSVLLCEPATAARVRHGARDANSLHAGSATGFVPLCCGPRKFSRRHFDRSSQRQRRSNSSEL